MFVFYIILDLISLGRSASAVKLQNFFNLRYQIKLHMYVLCQA